MRTFCLMVGMAIFVFAGCRSMIAPTHCETEFEIDGGQSSFVPVNFFVSPYFQQLRPRRVVIVTPQNRSHAFPDQDKFAIAFANQLRQFGVADAVIAPDRDCPQLAARNGRYDEQQLVDLSQNHNAEAVFYCDITSFSAYSPMTAAISVTMVDTRESVVLMAIDGVWDLRDPHTRSLFEFYSEKHQLGGKLSNQVIAQSPTEFLNFAAMQLANLMQRY